jgi:hypothetical protein
MTANFVTVTPPEHCEYAHGRCDQEMCNLAGLDGFFIYASQPKIVSQTIAEAVKYLQNHTVQRNYKSWESLNIGGAIIFCEICKAIHSAKTVVGDITTLNFNVLFELGYALGLGKAVVPVRDSSYERDKKLFEELGIFDTLGYQDFRNSADLAKLLTNKETFPIFRTVPVGANRSQPIYYLRSPIETDASMKLFSSLKKSYFRFRTFDVRETPRLSLHDAFRETLSSLAVVGHMIDPERTGAKVHNARVAFVCGMGMAAKKHVLILQEGMTPQPIDYRDVVVFYNEPSVIPRHVERLVRAVANTIQSDTYSDSLGPKGILETLNLGDVAAENEIQALSRYFVKTPQFQQAKQGHARIIVGRKGAGKTAIFYGVRQFLKGTKHNLVLDLKPEGHQFTKLRETVLDNLSEGHQLHTMTAFWHFLLLLELAKHLIDRDDSRMWQGPELIKRFRELKSCYEANATTEEADFSERLMAMVERVMKSFPKSKECGSGKNPISPGAIYEVEIKRLSSIIINYLNPNDVVWLLLDNIDKGWPARGAKKEDILILSCLLEAARKLQRHMEKQHVDFKAIVFVRKDIHDLLVDQTPDRGKDEVANLDWSDVELLKELLSRRFQAEADVSGKFDEVWARLFDAHVKGENSFSYILDRTFMRPRDILNFVRKSIQIAVSRSQTRVDEKDILTAEAAFSEDMLNDLRYEMRDVFPGYPEILNHFLLQSWRLSRDDISVILLEAGVTTSDIDKVIDMLLWFSFFGVLRAAEEIYSYRMLYNLPKLKSLLPANDAASALYVIHPAFRMALGSTP